MMVKALGEAPIQNYLADLHRRLAGLNDGALASYIPELTRADPNWFGMLGRYAGHDLAIDEKVCASEARTGHRNRALAHLMRNFDIIESDPEPGLDLYFRQCSVLVGCRDLALMGACLANNGVNLFHTGRATSASIIRTRFDATQVGSERRRRLAERDLLTRHGARIRVYELQGDLSIGATESLISEVLAELEGVDTLILDLGRVVNLDRAAARLLSDLGRDLCAGGRALLMPGAGNKYGFVRGVTAAWPESRGLAPFRFDDCDQALEWAEDRLLTALAPAAAQEEASLADNDLCLALGAEELAELSRIAQRLDYAPGALVFASGQAADALYLIARGQFEALLPQPGQPPPAPVHPGAGDGLRRAAPGERPAAFRGPDSARRRDLLAGPLRGHGRRPQASPAGGHCLAPGGAPGGPGAGVAGPGLMPAPAPGSGRLEGIDLGVLDPQLADEPRAGRGIGERTRLGPSIATWPKVRLS